jgi:HAD superfamily hydrolase (TIGR01458 family)
MEDVDGVLLDIDGVLTVSWRALPGSIGAIARIRERGLPFRLITNTTTHTRADLASTLQQAGFDVQPDEIVTAVVATGSYLASHHAGATVFVLSDGDAREDLPGVSLLGEPEEADVVVLGGACDRFSYEMLNRVFQRVMDGAALVGMHRNHYWRTSQGLQLDSGAYLAGLEAAVGVEAVVCGKPSAAYFQAALEHLGVPPDRAIMVGDDIVNDVMGAQAAGLRGVLVRTGKFKESDLTAGSPDLVVDSLGDFTDMLT